MLCFTVGSIRDVPRVRFLAESIARYHPDWPVWVVLTEPWSPSDDAESEAFSVLHHDELGVENLEAWLFMHNEMQTRLALKGPAAIHFLLQKQADKILFLDATSMVLGPLTEIEHLLDDHSVLLVPRLVKPAVGRRQILRREVTALREGSFDLGFFALRNDEQGRAFAQWWSQRLLNYCYQNDERGIYFEGKWCNLAPALFDRLYVLRDLSYNVTHGTVDGHVIRKENPEWLLDDRPIRIMRVSEPEQDSDPDGEPSKAGLQALQELYARELAAHALPGMSPREWEFATFSNGERITDDMRWIYRNRPDLRRQHPAPFATAPNSPGLLGFFRWQATGDKRP